MPELISALCGVQLVRLIEVLSVRNIRSSSLLEEARLDLTAQARAPHAACPTATITMMLSRCTRCANHCMLTACGKVHAVQPVHVLRWWGGPSQAGSQDMQRLQAAGWTPGCSIRQLVNFTGVSLSLLWDAQGAYSLHNVLHAYNGPLPAQGGSSEVHSARMWTCETSADLAAQGLVRCAGMRLVHRNHRGEKGLQAYREQLTKLLREGAAGGRIIKGPIAE